MEIMEIIKQRHSVRQYLDKPIETEKRAVFNEMIAQINNETGVNIQIFYDEPECFDSFKAHYGKFSGVKNYIALVGKKSAKLEETLGYYGEKLVLTAQKMGLNTCWVGLTYGKSNAVINKGEKLVCIIALGYGETQGVTHKTKTLKELCNYEHMIPDWFLDGMNAAILAPTAMNQQKFFFELLPDDTVRAKCGKAFFAKVDLGIVKYHFEVVTQKRVVT